MNINVRRPPTSNLQIYVLKEIEIKNQLRFMFKDAAIESLTVNLNANANAQGNYFKFYYEHVYSLDPSLNWLRNTDGRLSIIFRGLIPMKFIMIVPGDGRALAESSSK
jgi:hypothetical protein